MLKNINIKKNFNIFLIIILISCVLININIVRIIKDSYVITILGPEIITFCKVFLELPISIIFFFLYLKLSNLLNTETLARLFTILLLFLLFLLPFLFFKYYYYVTFSDYTIQYLISLFPYFKGIIFIIAYWPYTIYFVIAEIWPIVSYSFLFWQFINKINDFQSSKKYYIFYNLYSQILLLISGGIINYFISHETFLHKIIYFISFPVHDNDQILKVLSLLMFFFGLFSLLLYYLINKFYYFSKIKFFLTIRDSLFIILRSSNIFNILFMIISYSFSISIIYLTWLSALQTQYPSPIEFIQFQAYLNYWTGILSILFALLINKFIYIFGLLFSSKFTSILILVSGSIFYLFCIIFTYTLNPILILFVTMIGSIQYIFIRSSKYILFDTTKERLYTLIKNEEIKTKGKLIIDILGFKLGKFLGAFLLSFPMIFFPSQNYISISPVSFILLFVISFICTKFIKSSFNQYF